MTQQSQISVAIGSQAGNHGQGANCIAIGTQAGQTGQPRNSIILNASGSALNGETSNALYISPVRNVNGSTANGLYYDDIKAEVCYDENKTFVIDHPVDKNKYLVHACLEGPEVGVYYRGKAFIEENNEVTIKLPSYVEHLATNFTIQITHIYDRNNPGHKTYSTSLVENNEFTVFGESGSFFWQVYGERNSVNVEPNKKDVELKGDGPYTYLSEKLVIDTNIDSIHSVTPTNTPNISSSDNENKLPAIATPGSRPTSSK